MGLDFGFTALQLQCFPWIFHMVHPAKHKMTFSSSFLYVVSASPALELCRWAVLSPTIGSLTSWGCLVQSPPYIEVLEIATRSCIKWTSWTCRVFWHHLKTLFVLVLLWWAGGHRFGRSKSDVCGNSPVDSCQPPTLTSSCRTGIWAQSIHTTAQTWTGHVAHTHLYYAHTAYPLLQFPAQ